MRLEIDLHFSPLIYLPVKEIKLFYCNASITSMQCIFYKENESKII